MEIYEEKCKEWEETRCYKPKVVEIKGMDMTFLCLREKGHTGECMEAIAALKNRNLKEST